MRQCITVCLVESSECFESVHIRKWLSIRLAHVLTSLAYRILKHFLIRFVLVALSVARAYEIREKWLFIESPQGEMFLLNIKSSYIPLVHHTLSEMIAHSTVYLHLSDC